MKRLTVLAFVTLVAVSGAIADRPVDETRKASPGGTVSIELIAGDVVVVGGDRDEVRITGTLGDGVEELEFETRGRRTSIELVPRHSHNFRGGRTRIEVHVPAGSEMEVESISGSLSIDGVNGALSAESVSGSLTISGGARELELSTVSGRIEFTGDHPLEEGEFASVSGNILVSATLEPGGELSVETVSGGIELRLPADTSAEYDIETFSGGIDNEFGPRATTSELLPSKSLSFSVGSGTARVSVASFSGRIELLGK